MARKDRTKSSNMKQYWADVKAGKIKRKGSDAAADVVADNLPPPAAVAAAVADAAPAAADPAPAKRRRRRKGPFKGYKVDVERDGVLYVLNRFGRAYVRWMKQGGTRQGFI